ncbi:MAG: hypothetical protein K6F33_04835 [Bacteroidales bacterium]|nr:hypothetical protein [Bacteroidales bacterium]
MKKFITILLLAVATSTFAQTFNEKGNSIIEICTYPDYISVEGDLNKDGIQDVFVANKDENYVSSCALYMGQANGGYQMFQHPYYDLNLHKDAKITINDKGVLRIQNDDRDGSDIFLFRYQNGGFYLIGGKKDRHKSQHYDISYNFSTKKYIKTTGEGTSKTTENFAMSSLPTLKIGWFPLKWDMLEYLIDPTLDVEYKTVMGIFRLLQNNMHMHWAFCDYEYSEHNPTGSNGKYSCYKEYIGGSYWVYETLEFTKISDEEWRIEFGDEGGEIMYDDEGNNTGEPDEASEPEIFSFEDGMFIFG